MKRLPMSLVRKLFILAALSLTLIAFSFNAFAMPCCNTCPSWPDLNPYTDPCARYCNSTCGSFACGGRNGDCPEGYCCQYDIGLCVADGGCP